MRRFLLLLLVAGCASYSPQLITGDATFQYNELTYTFTNPRYADGLVALDVTIKNTGRLQGAILSPRIFLVDETGNEFPRLRNVEIFDRHLPGKITWSGRIRTGEVVRGTLYFETGHPVERMLLRIIPSFGSQSWDVPINYTGLPDQNCTVNPRAYEAYKEENGMALGLRRLSVSNGRISSATVYVKKAANFVPWDAYSLVFSVKRADGLGQQHDVVTQLASVGSVRRCATFNAIRLPLRVPFSSAKQNIRVTLREHNRPILSVNEERFIS